MRTPRTVSMEFRRPCIDSFFLSGTYLTLLWGTGWWIFFLLWLYGDGFTGVVGAPLADASWAS